MGPGCRRGSARNDGRFDDHAGCEAARSAVRFRSWGYLRRMVPVLEACAKKVAAQGPHARLQGKKLSTL